MRGERRLSPRSRALVGWPLGSCAFTRKGKEVADYRPGDGKEPLEHGEPVLMITADPYAECLVHCGHEEGASGRRLKSWAVHPRPGTLVSRLGSPSPHSRNVLLRGPQNKGLTDANYLTTSFVGHSFGHGTRGMTYQNPTLFRLAYACRLYRQIDDPSGLDKLARAAGAAVDLRNPNHTKALLEWLNDWQCRIKAGNRALTDIVAARDAALRLASFEALAGLFLLVRRQDRLAAELDAVGLCIGPAAGGALQYAAALQLGSNAEDRKDDLGEVGRGIEERFGK
jgi:hypothetical protein